MTSVVVPWRSSPDRVPLWEFLRKRWESAGFEVVEGYCDPRQPWCKGAAVADGMTRAAHGPVVIADADVWCDVDEALAHVALGRAWAVPHERVLRLTETATTALMDGAPPGPLAERPYTGRAGGGLVVLTRAAYEACPIDPRFAGWGQEDEAWSLALRCLYGPPWRGTADLIHLWHEPQPRDNRAVGSAESAALLRRYSAAYRNRDAMTALLDEARRWPDG